MMIAVVVALVVLLVGFDIRFGSGAQRGGPP